MGLKYTQPVSKSDIKEILQERASHLEFLTRTQKARQGRGEEFEDYSEIRQMTKKQYSQKLLFLKCVVKSHQDCVGARACPEEDFTFYPCPFYSRADGKEPKIELPPNFSFFDGAPSKFKAHSEITMPEKQ